MSNINKNIIKQAGAAVANATNKAAGLSAATPEPGTVISAIQLVNGGRSIGPAALAPAQTLPFHCTPEPDLIFGVWTGLVRSCSLISTRTTQFLLC